MMRVVARLPGQSEGGAGGERVVEAAFRAKEKAEKAEIDARASAIGDRGRGAGRLERRAKPPDALVGAMPELPELLEQAGEAQRELRFAAERPVERGADVVDLRLEPAQPFGSGVREEVSARPVSRDRGSVGSASRASRSRFGGVEEFARVFAYGLEHHQASLGVGARRAQEQVLSREAFERVEVRASVIASASSSAAPPANTANRANAACSRESSRP